MKITARKCKFLIYNSILNAYLKKQEMSLKIKPKLRATDHTFSEYAQVL